MKRLLVSAIAGIGILALSACSAPNVTPRQAESTPMSTEQPVEATEDLGEGEDAYAEDYGVEGYRTVVDDVPLFAFGDKATFFSQRSITVSYVEEMKLSEYGAGDCAPGDPVSIFKVTITNETGSAMSPYEDLYIVGYYDTEGGETLDASDVFDDYGPHPLDAGQSLPEHLMNNKSGSSYWGFCHPGGSADEVAVYGSFLDEYGDIEGDAVWGSGNSDVFKEE